MSLINKRNVAIGAVVIGIPILIIGWWLFSPLFLDTEVNEPFPMSANAEIPDDLTQEEAEEQMVEAAAAVDIESDEIMPAEESELVALSSGQFENADDFHQGSGTATIYELTDGSRVLRFEDFDVTNGPDLKVLLASGTSPGNSEELGDYIELDGLKGNIGDQNYEIPDDADLSLYSSVVIYCKPFHVVFSVATLG